jgi:hypothetical protein
MPKINGSDINYDAITNLNDLYNVNKKNVLLTDVTYNKLEEIFEETSQEVSFINNDADNGPKFIDAFTLKSDADWSVTSHNLLTEDAETFSEFSSSSLWFAFHSMFFSDRDPSLSGTIKHPWKTSTVSTIHCVHLSNELFKDYLIGFENELIFSLTGELSDETFGILGFSPYEYEELVFTDELTQAIFPTHFGENQIAIEKYEKLSISYSIVSARFYYGTGLEDYEIARGILFNDYGFLAFFDLETSVHITNWDDMRVGAANSSVTGSENIPALYLNNNSILYKKYYYDNKFDITCPWYDCNYTSNSTAISGESYMFSTIDKINDLALLDETSRPRTYINNILLFDDYNNLLAKCSLPVPIKKDYLNEYKFKLKVRR